MDSTADANLTGVWDGRFSYPRELSPTASTAVILDTGAMLSGTIHETPPDGPSAGQTLNATLTGRREGSSVSFLKAYAATAPGRYRVVEYRGVLNADATEIEGFWSIPGNWSGKFLMIRQRGQTAARRAGSRVAEPTG